MENAIKIAPEAQKSISQTELMVKDYDNFAIVAADQYTGAAEHLKLIKSKYKELEDIRKSLTTPLDESKRKIMDLFRKPLSQLENAESIIKRAMLSWQQDQERKRREEEARLQAQARKEEERKKKALEERARKAEAEGKTAKAEELRQKQEEVFVPVPVVPTQVEKVKGISTKTNWKFKIIDETLVPRDYLIIDEQKLGAVARATKGTLKVAGIEFFCEEVIASGR